ncbi:alpha/beta-hydrolase [Lentinus tigrinus ALCF2SS1-7]|uniref:Carboxylic ester hydrolase n=1 Tax=Lentinus tigrinus ALCF2SS1-6 TaxID=1328759 RepID=A0A5C2S571_9APHY|nr:alpha/beta-hydrolase [Lentinus tigrinus ALCF2SS1-6]RPD69871.1 alpha/beta-hydrolase [Lentinus tigrinus ALCF2SS1-7]
MVLAILSLLSVATHVWCSPVATGSVRCTPSNASTCPVTAQLDSATVVGVSDGMTSSYLCIPFAQPPVGKLRFNIPEPIGPYTGLLNATGFGNQCYNSLTTHSFPSPDWVTPEMADYFKIFNGITTSPFDEDCLNLNVIAPASILPGRKLPVVAYIFFGAFKFGSGGDVDGRTIVQRSIEMGEPVIFVSMNHRLGPYGFLGGKEVKAAKIGNLGLQDQREAFRWIKKYIHVFGGDSNRVTLLGLSSGGISSTLQMIANGADTEGLFHAVWAESGSVLPLGWIDQPATQQSYDNLISRINCSDAMDTLACLRAAPVDAINAAGALDISWQPHADGTFIKDLPQSALVSGDIAKLPVVAGNAEDEGTIFNIGYQNVTTVAQLEAAIRANFYADISDSDMQRLLQLYPNDAAKGAPYGTGDQFEFTPMWKRIGALMGDINVIAIRRLFVERLALQGQNVWTYIYRRNKVSAWGSTHGSEIPNMYGGGDMTDLLIHFANTHDPNGLPQKPYWPQYDLATRPMLDFYGNDSLRISTDTYRQEAIQFVIEQGLEHPWPV